MEKRALQTSSCFALRLNFTTGILIIRWVFVVRVIIPIATCLTPTKMIFITDLLRSLHTEKAATEQPSCVWASYVIVCAIFSLFTFLFLIYEIVKRIKKKERRYSNVQVSAVMHLIHRRSMISAVNCQMG